MRFSLWVGSGHATEHEIAYYNWTTFEPAVWYTLVHVLPVLLAAALEIVKQRYEFLYGWITKNLDFLLGRDPGTSSDPKIVLRFHWAFLTHTMLLCTILPHSPMQQQLSCVYLTLRLGHANTTASASLRLCQPFATLAI